MTSADELFRSYAAAFEAEESPSAAEYLGRLEGPERYALELMIDDYLTNRAPSRTVDGRLLKLSSQSAWAQRARELMAEPSPADVRLAREEQDMSVEELAGAVLAEGGIDSPSEGERNRAAEYLGRLEAGELGRLSTRAWNAVREALGTAVSPAAGSPAMGMAFRMSPPPPASPGTEPADAATGLPEAEVFLHAYATPSPKSWDRVDEFFLAED